MNMFGPNTYIKSNDKIDYSHRDKEFIELFSRVRDKFIDIFKLHEYDILFIPGSGTLGVEAVVWSVLNRIRVVGHDGVFKSKWKRLTETHKKETISYEKLYCHLETSNSSIFEEEGCIVDAISSFPYYDIPKDTNIFITCTNKQLGGYPGLSIIGVKKDYWTSLRLPKEFSYLNLSRYQHYNEINQTPSTTPTQIFEHFESVLDKFDKFKLMKKINDNSLKVVEAIGEENIIGEKICPVITIDKELISMGLARKYQLYGLYTKSPNYQIFTYSCDDEIYDRFCEELKNENTLL